jgi:hypothetical protein
MRCAVARSNAAIVAPPSEESAPKRTMPLSFIVSAGPREAMSIGCPIWKSPFLYEASSIATSFVFGHAPSASVSELKRGWLGSTEKPRLGAPPLVSTFPSFLMICASPATPPSAAATPSICFVFSRSLCGSVACTKPVSPSLVGSNAVFAVTTAFVPRYDSLKIVSKACWIVSVRTYVPLIIATPRTIAIAVRAARSLRPSRPRTATRITARARSSQR